MGIPRYEGDCHVVANATSRNDVLLIGANCVRPQAGRPFESHPRQKKVPSAFAEGMFS